MEVNFVNNVIKGRELRIKMNHSVKSNIFINRCHPLFSIDGNDRIPAIYFDQRSVNKRAPITQYPQYELKLKWRPINENKKQLPAVFNLAESSIRL